MSNVKWRDAFEKQRQITEKRNTSRFTKYYQSQYNKGVDNIIATGSTDYTSLFTISFFNRLYHELYDDTSMHFAKWYARTFDKYLWSINPDTLVIECKTNFNIGSIGKYKNKKINIKLNEKIKKNLQYHYNIFSK